MMTVTGGTVCGDYRGHVVTNLFRRVVPYVEHWPAGTLLCYLPLFPPLPFFRSLHGNRGIKTDICINNR